MTSHVDCKIETQVYEVYIKSIVTQNFINPYNQPLELKILFNKRSKYSFQFFPC